MTESDHELMDRSRRGDTTAFEILVRRWEQPVTAILNRLNNTKLRARNNEVEDLSQEVFLRVLTARNRYHNGYAFSTWLYRIALNVSRDAARRHRTRNNLLNRPQPLEQAETAHKAVTRKETEQLIAEALATLPDEMREPLILRHYGNLTFSEVSDVLGVAVSTVKSRVRIALLKLRTELKQRGIDEQELDS